MDHKNAGLHASNVQLTAGTSYLSLTSGLSAVSGKLTCSRCTGLRSVDKNVTTGWLSSINCRRVAQARNAQYKGTSA
jgi:hypothetical protein